MLKVDNLRVTFNVRGRTIEAVRRVSFSIHEGESIAIVGESGCGKSATALALTRLTPGIISGHVWFDGEDLLTKTETELRTFRGRKLGMIFQDPLSSLNPTMRVGNQIIEALLFHKLMNRKKAEEKALELLRLTGISDPETRYRQYPHQLSGGQRQRVMIAIALSCTPRLIIADEPTTALDANIQMQILTLLKDLQTKFQTSLLLISHDLSLVASLCEKIIVMYAGQIVESGTAIQLLQKPEHPYTQMLLRCRPTLSTPKTAPLPVIDGAPPNLFEPIQGCPFRDRCPRATDRCKEPPPLRTTAFCWNPL